MKIRIFLIAGLFALLKYACASPDEPVNDSPTKGIQFTANITNSAVSSNDPVIIHCVIKNTTTNRIYFCPWEPAASTQVFMNSADAKPVRLTQDDMNRYEGGPTFNLEAAKAEAYNFEVKSNLVHALGNHTLFCEMHIYFDESESEIHDHGMVVYKIRSNLVSIDVQ